MQKRILIEGNELELRVAIVESGRLAELFIEPKNRRSLVGTVFKGKVSRVLPGIQSAFVDVGLERQAFLFVDDATGRRGRQPALADDNPQKTPPIEELVQPGAELLVQVVKDPLPHKGARITTQIALPGRYLVLLPCEERSGVSRRIEETEERERLEAVLDDMSPEGVGLIARTASSGVDTDLLESDLAVLLVEWSSIQESFKTAAAPAELRRELPIEEQVLRDRATEPIGEIWVDDEELLNRLQTASLGLSVGPPGAIRLHAEGESLFERFGVEEQIAAALESRVPLDSGGHLVIQSTEALVAIDVNTGRDVGRGSFDETILRTNLEAAAEVARQIRLRDLSGIIVVDFIDMTGEEDREKVFETLQEALLRDPARTQLLRISEFGLVEITRRRDRTNVEAILTRPCPDCHGSGRILSIDALKARIWRSVVSAQHNRPDRQLVLSVHPEVHATFQNGERDLVHRLNHRHVRVHADRELSRERFKLEDEQPA